MISSRMLAVVAAAVVVVVAAAAVLATGMGDREEAPPTVYTATVWLDDGVNEPVEYEGTGATPRDVIRDALSEHVVTINSSGNVTSVDGKRNSADGSWAVFRWSSPDGWAVFSGSSLFDGMTLAVSYAERTASDDGTVGYSAPEIEVEYTVHYFIQFKEEYNSTDWMRTLPLTDADKQAGVWISGTGSDNNEALADAILNAFFPDAEVVVDTGSEGSRNYISYIVDGQEGLFRYGTSSDMYGWFLSFFGWGDTKVGEGGEHGTWTYWSQYSYNPASDDLGDPDYWDYNQWSFGLYDISQYRYFGLVLQTTQAEDAEVDLPAPSTMPSEV